MQKKLMKLLIMLPLMSLINSCSYPHNYIISKECRFYDIVESDKLSGDKDELAKIKKNNINACYNCLQITDLIECQKTLKLRQKIRKRLEREYK